MKREEAISVLKAISGCRQNLSPNSIMLVQAQQNNQLSVGYQLHIRMALDPYVTEQIQAIASQNNLAVHKETKESIIIYRPKTVNVTGLEPTLTR